MRQMAGLDGAADRTTVPSGGLCPAVRFWRTGNNGDNRIRTGDPLLAKQVLYQLSYVPRDSPPLGHDLPWGITHTERQHPNSWWAREDLNLRPHAYQACALTN